MDGRVRKIVIFSGECTILGGIYASRPCSVPKRPGRPAYIFRDLQKPGLDCGSLHIFEVYIRLGGF